MAEEENFGGIKIIDALASFASFASKTVSKISTPSKS